MADLAAASPHLFRLAYAGLAGMLLFLRLLPLDSAPGGLPGPDLLLAVTFAWVLRRPDFVPVWLIALILLMEDLLLMRPPGLWAALVVLGAEFLRSRAAFSRELGLLLEWAMVAVVMVLAALAYRLVLAVAFLPQVALGQALVQVAITILCYPAVVALSRLAFGLRKPATGEVDAHGRRM
ncbi:MAG: rod shape-determining protein MreD [Rhodobacterales bacterium]|nr:rod shape-determining protein MreD [Rhodobacterales bacterium]